MAEGEGESKAGAADDTVLKQLTAQLAVLTKRTQIEDQRRKLLDLNLTADKLPGGTYEVKGETPPIEGVILAHDAVAALADRIAKLAVEKGVTRIRLQSATDGKLLAGLAVLNMQLTMMSTEANAILVATRDALGDRVGVAEVAILPFAGALLNSAVQLAGLFRVDRVLTNAKIELNQRALVTALAGALLKENVTVSEGVSLPGTPLNPAAESVSARVLKLGGLRQQLSSAISRIVARTAELPPNPDTPAPEALSEDPVVSLPLPQVLPGLPQLSLAERQALAAAQTSAAAAIVRLDAFIKTLTTVDQAAGTSPLSEALLAERLRTFLDVPNTHILICEAQAGGASQTTKSAFRSWLSFSGGAVVSFTLSDSDGVLKEAATLTAHSGFVSLDEVQSGNTRLRTWITRLRRSLSGVRASEDHQPDGLQSHLPPRAAAGADSMKVQ